jgi:hypothetical protein
VTSNFTGQGPLPKTGRTLPANDKKNENADALPADEIK